jgi:putative ABC transport system permease protein
MNSILFDLRFAARSLRRRPTFAVVAIATIALAIGAATSIFSIVDGVLFRGLPYNEVDKFVAVWQTHPSWKQEPILAAMWDRIPLDYGDYLRWRARQTSFSAIGVWTRRSARLSGGKEPEIVNGMRVSPSLFGALGVKPIVGRTFLSLVASWIPARRAGRVAPAVMLRGE